MKKRWLFCAIVTLFLPVAALAQNQGFLNTLEQGVPTQTGLPSQIQSPSGNPYTSDLDTQVTPSLQPEYSYSSSRDPFALVNRIIGIALGFIGTILLVLMVRAGFLWMTAAGNEDQVSTAKTSIRNAVIGLVIIFCAYSFVYFLGRSVQRATRGYGNGGLLQGIWNDITNTKVPTGTSQGIIPLGGKE